MPENEEHNHHSDLMREHVNRPQTNFFAILVTVIILALNGLLLWQTFSGALPF